MPIRFRCAYCNQLLGIARRKAGTVVRCPTCAGQVIVPAAPADEPDSSPGQDSPLVFERSDFDELLESKAIDGQSDNPKKIMGSSDDAPIALPTPSAPLPGAWGTHPEPAFDVERINPVPAAPSGPESRRSGIFLSPAKTTLLVIVVVVAMALAFAAGVMVGYTLQHAPAPSGQSSRARVEEAPSGLTAPAKPDAAEDLVQRRHVEG